MAASTPPVRQVSRRTTLATGTAAVAAWTTPLVLSSAAEAAQGGCTPKCIPDASGRTITVTILRYCPAKGSKQIFLSASISDPDGVCRAPTP